MTEKEISERYIRLVFYYESYESAIDALLAKMVSLAELAKQYSEKSLGYVILRWMCSRKTLRFFHQWENNVNEEFDDTACEELLHQGHITDSILGDIECAGSVLPFLGDGTPINADRTFHLSQLEVRSCSRFAYRLDFSQTT